MRKKVLWLLIIMGGSIHVFGQNVTNEESSAILNNQAKILQYQRMLEENTLKRNEDAYKKPQKFLERLEIPVTSTADKSTQNITTFFIQHIHVKNVTKLSQKTVRKTVAPYEGKNLAITDIIELAKKLTNDYLKRGYVTCRITIPSQNLKSGILELTAVEGKIDHIVMKGPKTMVFPWLEGRVVQLRDLEQGIDQINRLRSNNGEMSILPSEKEGYSTIVIQTNETEKKNWATLSVDTGAFGDNDFRPGTGFVVENLVNLYDSWFFNTSDEGRYGANSSQSRIVSGTLPFGYWTFLGQYSKSAYLNRVKGRVRLINNSGETESYTLGSERVVWRGARSRASLFLHYSSVDVESKVEDVINNASTFKLSTLRGGVNYSLGTSVGTLSTSLGLHKGVDWSGEKKDSATLARDEPHAQFKKLVASASFFRPSAVFHWPLSWRSSVQVQYANTSLYSSERLGIGGVFSVRGTAESLSGERGILIRNDLSLPLSALTKLPVIKNHAVGVTVDGGYAWTRDKYSSYTKGGAVGAGLTLNGRKKAVFWGMSYSLPVKVSSFLEKDSGRFAANAGFEF